MPNYRIYRMTNDSQGIVGPAHIVECANEDEALQIAQQAVGGHDVELWDGARLVCRLPRNT